MGVFAGTVPAPGQRVALLIDLAIGEPLWGPESFAGLRADERGVQPG